MRRIRSHLTYANVMASLAVFIALGGTAIGAIIVSSNSQVAKDTIAGHHPPNGKHSNLIAGSVNGEDVANESLTGRDIKNRSGVLTCKPSTVRYGAICVDATHLTLKWDDAMAYCTDLGLRLPTLTEAVALAKKFDVPDVSDNQPFWTQDRTLENNGTVYVHVRDTGSFNFVLAGGSDAAICVTDPSA